MKDLHCHIMYGIDDGSKTLEESMSMLEKLYKEGTTDIILTPHYIEDSKYICNNKKKKQRYEEIKEEAKKRNLKINIYLGNEVMVNNNLLKQLDTEITTLNDSRYLLIESPMDKEYEDLDIVIKQLINKGITPIIAHPERYSFVQKNYKWVEEYIKLGALFQGNYESLFGKYGKNAKKTLKKLLKNNYIHFFGSDMHHKETKVNLKDLNKVLKRIIRDEKTIKDITSDNFMKVVNNEII